jgi:flagellar protein FliO/FliZ
MFENLFGTETPLGIGLCLAFLIVLGLFGAVTWAAPLFGSRRLGGAGNPRLSVIDSASVDRHRRFILIRRDNVEHLLLIGGSTDVVVEPNIPRATAAPLEVPVPASPASPTQMPNAIPQADKGSRPSLPKPATILRRAPQIEPLPLEPAKGQLRAQADSTGLQRQSLAALANELSTRPPAPRKSSATVVQPQPIEPQAELGSDPGQESRSEPAPESRPEHSVEPQPEPPMEPPQPAQPAVAETTSPEATSAEIASSADEELAQLARLLEAKLRKPNVPANARPSAAPARVAPPPLRAPAAQAIPTPPPQRTPAAEGMPAPPPLRARSPSDPKSPPVDTKPKQSTLPSDSLEQQLSNMLGRPTRY